MKSEKKIGSVLTLVESSLSFGYFFISLVSIISKYIETYLILEPLKVLVICLC